MALKSKDSDFRIMEVKLKSDLGDFTRNDWYVILILSQECIAIISTHIQRFMISTILYQ